MKIDASRTCLGIKKIEETTDDYYYSGVFCRITNENFYLGQGPVVLVLELSGQITQIFLIYLSSSTF